MRDTHRRVVEITSDNPRTVEQIIHELKKEADNAARYGETVEVRQVDLEGKDVEGFNNE
jgi:predicted lipid-binding transport protein (Tim44 family)